MPKRLLLYPNNVILWQYVFISDSKGHIYTDMHFMIRNSNTAFRTIINIMKTLEIRKGVNFVLFFAKILKNDKNLNS